MRKLLLILALVFATTVHGAKTTPARAVLIFDYTNNTVNTDENIHQPMPIASLTKLMTAYVVLESRFDLDELVPVTAQRLESSPVLRPGMQVTRRELLTLALVSSDNLAAKLLATSDPAGFDAFIFRMNATAQRLGMWNTEYIDPSGLLVNTSTAWDMHLLNRAVAKYSIFTDAAMSKTAQAEAQNKKGLLQQLIIRNTSAFAGAYDIKVGKTGYTRPAGWCISMLIRHEGQEFDIIVLGSPSKAARNQLVEQRLKQYMNIVTRNSLMRKIELIEEPVPNSPL